MNDYAIIAIVYTFGMFGMAMLMGHSVGQERRENKRLRHENQKLRDQIENVRKWVEPEDDA